MASQKAGNSMTGSEMQREKEKVAAKMREKQAAGEPKNIDTLPMSVLTSLPADARKAEVKK
jgi:hypothetical protein